MVQMDQIVQVAHVAQVAHVDWAAFTPWAALSGGALIGVAAVALLLVNGRIAGISGIVGGLFAPKRGDMAWRLAFVGGLLAAPWLLSAFGGRVLQGALGGAAAGATNPMNAAGSAGLGDISQLAVLVVAGLLVGLGTRYGSGCTSGHGVCGLARGSRRSLVATLVFMAAGFIIVYALRHVLV